MYNRSVSFFEDKEQEETKTTTYSTHSSVDVSPPLFRIVVIGYYYHDNLGDQQYIDTFSYLFRTAIAKCSFTFIDCDKIDDFVFQPTDVIIIGGGDVLNDYFLDKVIANCKDLPNKILAVSVGIPYNDILINTTKLYIFDYIFVRTTQEFHLFAQYYDAKKIFYIPDLSCLTTDKNFTFLEAKEADTETPFDGYIKEIEKKNKNHLIIGFSFNRHIYTKKRKDSYEAIVKEFAKIVKFTLESGYAVVFIPYNTSQHIADEEDNQENDILIHNDICKELKEIVFPYLFENVVNIQSRLSTKELLEVYNHLFINVPMRFHGTLFSIYKNIPFISIYTTKKIHNLLLDIQYNATWSYEMVKDEEDIPTVFDSKPIIKKLQLLESHNVWTGIRRYLSKVNLELKEITYNIIPTLIDIITQRMTPEYSVKERRSSLYEIETPIHKQMMEWVHVMNEYCGGKDFRLEKDTHKKSVLVSMINYYITNSLHSKYDYGLYEKMFHPDYDFLKEWYWILQDFQKNPSPMPLESRESGLFNVNLISQEDNSNVHRFGWKYVYDKMKEYHNEEKNLLLDLYVDRTFHWELDALKALKIVPYTKPWMGFIHHTFDTSFSAYNNVNLIRNEYFVESLKTCKGLFVLSKKSKQLLDCELAKMGISVRVSSLVHPTEVDVECFKYEKFLKNKDKKLLHVGGWLRNVFLFYQLNLPKTVEVYARDDSLVKKAFLVCLYDLFHSYPTIHISFKKTLIKNINGNNYVPSGDFLDHVKTFLSEEYCGSFLGRLQDGSKEHQTGTSTESGESFISCSHPVNGGCGGSVTAEWCSTGGSGKNDAPYCSRGDSKEDYEISTIIRNNWNRHLYEYLNAIIESIDVIEKVSNEEYDKLLTENIVFLCLVDCSAVNTVIECIVRNTPFIINKHPAIVELLGSDYPLYYSIDGENNLFTINEQINQLLSNQFKIWNAYKHLKKIDKSTFELSTFMHNFFHEMKDMNRQPTHLNH